MQYLRDIANITKAYNYQSVNQNDTSFINSILKSEVSDSKDYVKVLSLNSHANLVMVDTQLLMS